MSSNVKGRIFFLALFTAPIFIIQIGQCRAKIEITQLANGECLVNGMAMRDADGKNYQVYDFEYGNFSLFYLMIKTRDGQLALIDKSTGVEEKCKWKTGEIKIWKYDSPAANLPSPCRFVSYNGRLFLEFQRNGIIKLGKCGDGKPMTLESNHGPIVVGDTEYLLLKIHWRFAYERNEPKPNNPWVGFQLFKTSPECKHYKRQGRTTLDFGKFIFFIVVYNMVGP